MHSSAPLCASGRRLSVTGLLGRATERTVRRRSGRPHTATQDAHLRAALRERTAPERHRVAGAMGDEDLARNAPRQRRRGQRRRRTRISAAWGRSEPQPEGPRDARYHPPGPARKVSVEPADQRRKEEEEGRGGDAPINTNQPARRDAGGKRRVPAKTSLPECTASLETTLSASHLRPPDLRDAKRVREKRYATNCGSFGGAASAAGHGSVPARESHLPQRGKRK